jgi:hypothetical protein
MNEEQWLSCPDPAPMLDFMRASGKLTRRKARLFAVTCCRRVQHLLTADYIRHCPGAIDAMERHADGLATDEELWVAACGTSTVAVDAANAIAHPAGLSLYAFSCAAEAAEVAARADTTTDAAHAAARAIAYDSLARAADETVAAVAEAWQAQGWRGRAQWDADEDAVASSPAYTAAYFGERGAQATLLRCLFGNPCQPQPAIPASVLAWSNGTVRRLAEAAYEERDLPRGTLDNSRLAILADALDEAGCTDVGILAHLRAEGAVHARGCVVLDLLLGKE